MDVGFYGKLPSHGDFLRRRTSDAFVLAWDGWLQAAMTASRTALGDRWLDVYLTSPVWRFACGPGACGPHATLGIMAPSVDRVGRYFPLAVVTELPADVDALTAAIHGAPFLDRAERLLMTTLESDYVELEAFDRNVVALADELASLGQPRAVTLDVGATAILTNGATAPWQVPIASSGELSSVLLQLLSHALAARFSPLVLWWTEGSGMVEPSCLLGRGLPPADAFPALLTGDWSRHHWQTAAAHVERRALEDDLASVGRVSFRSAAATDVGRVRPLNQDAFLERPEIGLWVVADGLGGHADGEIASRAVCDALADFVPRSTFDDTIQAVRQRMDEVNEHLLRAASRSLLGDRCSSTVALLLVRDRRAAVLWAGDSRVYRWRTGRLDLLTDDHSASSAATRGGPQESHAVTRAVGAQARLILDLVSEEVRPGDRFLLCSDGLTRLVPESELQAWLGRPDIGAVVDGLIETTLQAGAPDNVTALVAEAYDDSV